MEASGGQQADAQAEAKTSNQGQGFRNRITVSSEQLANTSRHRT